MSSQAKPTTRSGEKGLTTKNRKRFGNNGRKNPETLSKRQERKERQAKTRALAKTDPNIVVKTLGGHGVDPAAQGNQSTAGVEANLKVQGVSSKMDVRATIVDHSVSNAAMGFVLTAIRNGWMSSIKTGETPYAAFRFIIDSIKTVLSGGAPTITNGPRAFWEFLAAVKPKPGGFKTSEVKYTWGIEDSGIADAIQYQVGNSTNPYYVFWGQDDFSSTINGFPVLVDGTGTYTPEKGADSFSSMCDYLGKGPMTMMSGDPGEGSFLTSDTSAFSVVYPEIGMSAFTPGGAAITIYSERHITSPLLAKFAEYQPVGQYYRGWADAAKNGGSPCYVIPRLLECKTIQDLNNKASPIVKFYNFDEFYAVLALTCGMALQNYYSNLGSTGVTTCPLTAQEVQILLRQNILSVMHNHLAQDLTLGNDFYPITPFVVGPNGVSLNQATMLLPLVLCENIRASCRRIVSLGGKKYPGYCADYIPLLARPITLPQLGNYSVTINEASFDIFTTAPSEVPMSLIDCSVPDGSSTKFLSLQGEAYESLTAAWNEWIVQLSSCLSPLTAVAAESGVVALSTVFYTNTEQDQPGPGDTIATPTITKQNSSKDVKNQNYDLRIRLTPSPVLARKAPPQRKVPKNRGNVVKRIMSEGTPVPVAPSYIDFWTEKEILCNTEPNAPCFRILRDWILPSHLSTGEQNQASLQAWRSFFIEPFIVSKTIAGGEGGDTPAPFPGISSRLQRMASLDTKAFTSGDQQNSVVSDLMALAVNGRGGFFAQIAGTLAGAFIPGSGEIVNNIASSFGL